MVIKQTYKVQIEVLSPLHIGSGNKLLSGQDYFLNNNSIQVISFDELLQKFSHDRMALAQIADKLSKRKPLTECFNLKKSLLRPKYVIKTEGFVPGNEISEQYKLPDLKPAIPGSSLKGAIRTVLLQYALKRNPQLKAGILQDRGKKDTASQAVFGDKANFDPLRVLIVDDFSTLIDALSVFTVKLFDIKNENSYGWKNFTSRIVEDQISKATPILIESIRPGSQFNEGTISIDTFTLEKLKEKGHIGIFSDIFSDFFPSFLRIANEYVVEESKKEIEFLKNFNRSGELAKVINFLEQIKKSASEDKNHIYLRLAWGIGWKGMTGDYFSDKEITETIKMKYRLGKYSSGVFPKTRRLVTVSENGRETPLCPTGWIRIRRIQ